MGDPRGGTRTYHGFWRAYSLEGMSHPHPRSLISPTCHTCGPALPPAAFCGRPRATHGKPRRTPLSAVRAAPRGESSFCNKSLVSSSPLASSTGATANLPCRRGRDTAQTAEEGRSCYWSVATGGEGKTHRERDLAMGTGRHVAFLKTSHPSTNPHIHAPAPFFNLQSDFKTGPL